MNLHISNPLFGMVGPTSFEPRTRNKTNKTKFKTHKKPIGIKTDKRSIGLLSQHLEKIIH